MALGRGAVKPLEGEVGIPGDAAAPRGKGLPRRYCEGAWPCAAASSNQRIASAGSRATPRPSAKRLPISKIELVSPESAESRRDSMPLRLLLPPSSARAPLEESIRRALPSWPGRPMGGRIGLGIGGAIAEALAALGEVGGKIRLADARRGEARQRLEFARLAGAVHGAGAQVTGGFGFDRAGGLGRGVRAWLWRAPPVWPRWMAPRPAGANSSL